MKSVVWDLVAVIGAGMVAAGVGMLYGWGAAMVTVGSMACLVGVIGSLGESAADRRERTGRPPGV